MKIIGEYLDNGTRLYSVHYGSIIALEVSAVWVEGWSRSAEDTKFTLNIRSGCYIFEIRPKGPKGSKYFDKNQAVELLKTITFTDTFILDDANVALYGAWDTTPYEVDVRNPITDDGHIIPLEVL